jgi:hypothetical protein
MKKMFLIFYLIGFVICGFLVPEIKIVPVIFGNPVIKVSNNSFFEEEGIKVYNFESSLITFKLKTDIDSQNI